MLFVLVGDEDEGDGDMGDIGGIIGVVGLLASCSKQASGFFLSYIAVGNLSISASGNPFDLTSPICSDNANNSSYDILSISAR